MLIYYSGADVSYGKASDLAIAGRAVMTSFEKLRKKGTKPRRRFIRFVKQRRAGAGK